MSYLTLKVEIDHGQIAAAGPEKLPEKGVGLLIIFPPDVTDLKASSPAVGQNIMQKLAHVSAGSQFSREEMNARDGEKQSN